MSITSVSYGQRAVFSDDSLIIIDKGRHIKLPKVIDLDPIACVVHAIQKRGADYYVVIGVTEWSRGGPLNGLCGSGIESYLMWIHVRQGVVAETQKGLYESCWDGRSAVLPAWMDKRLKWGVSYVRIDDGGSRSHAEQISWAYDPAAPETGIQEQRKTIPER